MGLFDLTRDVTVIKSKGGSGGKGGKGGSGAAPAGDAPPALLMDLIGDDDEEPESDDLLMNLAAKKNYRDVTLLDCLLMDLSDDLSQFADEDYVSCGLL